MELLLLEISVKLDTVYVYLLLLRQLTVRSGAGR